MRKSFIRKDKAVKYKEELDSKSLGFCPIINDSCRTDCICFVKAEITPVLEKTGRIFYVSKPLCKYLYYKKGLD